MPDERIDTTAAKARAKAEFLRVLADMPDEAFSWLMLAALPKGMTHGATAQIWPDGLGGFQIASRTTIVAAAMAAAAWTGIPLPDQTDAAFYAQQAAEPPKGD